MSEVIVPDQRVLWNQKHAQQEHAEFRGNATEFAVDFEATLGHSSTILDLACGVGGDAVYFAQQGHRVIATELSDEVLAQNQQLIANPNLHFVQSDMSEGLPLSDQSCDGVYANLALHYFDDATTRNVFKDIARVLKPGGLLAFACKSTYDPGFGKGSQIEPDFFVSSGGHARHFFSVEYVQEITEGLFDVENIQEVDAVYSEPVSFIYCNVRKIDTV